MIVFIDTEVNPQTKKVADYGAVREDGAVLHTHSKADFDAFVSRCGTVCGHNIIRHDLKYLIASAISKAAVSPFSEGR